MCSHNIENFIPLATEIGIPVWGTPANFKGFCMFASLLHRRRATDVNETLHDVWSSPGLLHYIYISGDCCPLREFCHMQNLLCIQVLRSPILSVLLHSARAVGVSQTLWHGVQGVELRNFYRGRHLYSARRPSRCASGNILVQYVFRLPCCASYISWLLHRMKIWVWNTLFMWWTCILVSCSSYNH